jgi:hypothetical protein
LWNLKEKKKKKLAGQSWWIARPLSGRIERDINKKKLHGMNEGKAISTCLIVATMTQ